MPTRTCNIPDFPALFYLQRKGGDLSALHENCLDQDDKNNCGSCHLCQKALFCDDYKSEIATVSFVLQPSVAWGRWFLLFFLMIALPALPRYIALFLLVFLLFFAIYCLCKSKQLSAWLIDMPMPLSRRKRLFIQGRIGFLKSIVFFLCIIIVSNALFLFVPRLHSAFVFHGLFRFFDVSICLGLYVLAIACFLLEVLFLWMKACCNIDVPSMKKLYIKQPQRFKRLIEAVVSSDTIKEPTLHWRWRDDFARLFWRFSTYRTFFAFSHDGLVFPKLGEMFLLFFPSFFTLGALFFYPLVIILLFPLPENTCTSSLQMVTLQVLNWAILSLLYYNYAMEFHVRSSLQSFNDCMLIPGLENIQAYNYQLMPLVEDMFDGKINMIANVIILAVIPLYIAIMTVFLKNGG